MCICLCGSKTHTLTSNSVVCALADHTHTQFQSTHPAFCLRSHLCTVAFVTHTELCITPADMRYKHSMRHLSTKAIMLSVTFSGIIPLLLTFHEAVAYASRCRPSSRPLDARCVSRKPVLLVGAMIRLGLH